MDKPHRYEETSQKAKKSTLTRPDEYYGRPQATVITEVLEKRKAAGFGATNLNELYDELKRGQLNKVLWYEVKNPAEPLQPNQRGLTVEWIEA